MVKKDKNRDNPNKKDKNKDNPNKKPKIQSLSQRNLNRVNLHDDTCHTKQYVDIENIKDVERKVNNINHNDLLGYHKNEHIDWTIKQKDDIDYTNIGRFSVIQYENDIDHNNLQNYNENEHIDWTKNQKKEIHKQNIPDDLVTQHQGKINHNKLRDYNENEHIDWTKKQDKIIPLSNIEPPSNYIDWTKKQKLFIPASNIEPQDHNKLKNYNYDNHIPHSSIEIKTGNGLSGGGDLSTTRIIKLEPATSNRLGGVKVGDGLSISEKDNKLSVDKKLFPQKWEFQIKTEDWIQEGTKYLYYFEYEYKYPCIFCWDLKYNKVVYPEIKVKDDKILISMKRKLDMLVKIFN